MSEPEKKYRVTIGLEVHAQLNTKSKLFCSCSTKFGAPPNTHTCPVCLGLPGALPVLNQQAVESAIKLGLATQCHIAEKSVFARKNYFYPDLPKGYQITQFDRPICQSGFLEIEQRGKRKKIAIERIHLEEDAGKSIHNEPFVPSETTLIDLNRCGIPLLEIVTHPEIENPEEAVQFVRHLQLLLRYLRISDANLEEGSLRCDANISVRLSTTNKLTAKTEIKNLNSLKALSRALIYEIDFQKQLIISGKRHTSATVLWDEKSRKTRPMRSKETAHDYRYFPEPDLPPLIIGTDLISKIKAKLPELPGEKTRRFISKYHLTAADAEILIESPDRADFFERLGAKIGDDQLAGKWVIQEFLRYEKKLLIEKNWDWETSCAEILLLIKNRSVNWGGAKKIFAEMVTSKRSAAEVLQESHFSQINDTEKLTEIIRQVIYENEDALAQYQSGKQQLFHFFLGQVMQKTSGQADPKLANEILKKILATM